MVQTHNVPHPLSHFSDGFHAARQRATRGFSPAVILAYSMHLGGAQWREGVAAFVDVKLGSATPRAALAAELGLVSR